MRSSALAEMSRTIAPWRSAGPTRITVNPDLNGGPSLLFLPRDQDTGA